VRRRAPGEGRYGVGRELEYIESLVRLTCSHPFQSYNKCSNTCIDSQPAASVATSVPLGSRAHAPPTAGSVPHPTPCPL
jgi:hypothetical protein